MFKQVQRKKICQIISGFISKKIISSDLAAGEVTIELSLSNIAQAVEQKESGVEIMFVLDTSGSMKETISTGETRWEAITNVTEDVVGNLLDEQINDLKIGIVTFNGPASAFEISPYNREVLACPLTNNSEQITTSIEQLKLLECKDGTCTEGGIVLANNTFSSKNNTKILILLSDGVPNASIKHFCSNVSSDTFYNAFYTNVANDTVNKLNEINQKGVNIISMLTEVTGVNEQDAVLRVFGTPSNPTVGRFYYTADNQIESIVKNNIYEDIIEKIQQPINNIVIKDVFPDNIINNFTFEYVGTPNVGTATASIDTATKDITWNIATLKGDGVATLKYKLRIKDMKNESLLDKVISTNEKVVLNYKNSKDEAKQAILTSSPQIKLVEKEKTPDNNENNSNSNSNNNNNGKDNTVVPGILPQAGTILMSVFIVIFVIGAVISWRRFVKYKDI